MACTSYNPELNIITGYADAIVEHNNIFNENSSFFEVANMRMTFVLIYAIQMENNG